MKKILGFLIFILINVNLFGQQKLIHVFVALCDNENQGIVPVPEKIGNGKNPNLNLYWGAGYGVKTFFNIKTTDWTLLKTINSDNPIILERLLFKHKSLDSYLLADAYDGERIQDCIEDFLKSSNGQNSIEIQLDNQTLVFGGGADLLAYIGHNGLMDFEIGVNYYPIKEKKKDIMILACFSREYFKADILEAKANPVLWTTHLMAPEAYTLKAAIDGWLNNESGKEIEERAAQTYNEYQKCGIKGARNLFTTGF